LDFSSASGKSPRLVDPMRKVLRSLNNRMRVRGWIALLILVAAAAVGLPSVLKSRFVSQRRAAFALKRAEAQRASRHFQQARTEFRAALQLEPGDSVARRELAELELGLGNTELAFLEYESLTEMHPEDPRGWVKLAELMVQSGQLEAPEALLDKAIELDPQRGDARLLRGNIRLRLGRYYGAVQDARAAVAATPDDVECWVLLVRSVARSQGAEAGLQAATQAIGKVGEQPGLASLRTGLQPGGTPDLGPPPAPSRRLRADALTGRGNLGAWTREHWPGHLAEIRQSFEEALKRHDWTEAQRTVDSAASAYPGSAFAPYLGGMLALARGDLGMAERSFSEARASAPRLPQTLAALGRTWSRKGGPLFTGEQLLRVGTVDPDFSLARYMAARAFIEAQDPLRAEAALRMGLQLQPQSPVPYQQLTDYDFGLERTAEALEVSRQGLERFPNDIGLQMMLAQIEEATGQQSAAIATYEGLLASKPDVDFAQYKLAMLLAADQGDEAHQRLLTIRDKLRGDTPADPALLDALGWLSYKANDLPRARALLELAVQDAPEEPSHRYHLAMVYAQDGETARAREELQAALDSPRPFPERIDAVRLLRLNDNAQTQNGKLSVTSRPH
jgi:tetratricopeptide (TPR) repeat protein